MTQQEFQERVKMTVSAEEYDAIETVYLTCDLNKDEFCKMWVQMNKSRVERAIKEAKAKEVAQSIKENAWKIYNKLTAINHRLDNYFIIASNSLGKRDCLFLRGELNIDTESLTNGQVQFKLREFLFGEY